MPVPVGIQDKNGAWLALGAPVSLGRYTVTSTTTGTSLATLLGGTVLADAINAGASFVIATVETNDVRVAFDGSDPSSNGFLYAKANGQPYVWDISDLTQIKLAGQTASATVRVGLMK